VYLPDVYLRAAKALVAEGKASAADFPLQSDGFRGVQDGFIDGVRFDAKKPNEYLKKFRIGLKADERA
jgi:nitrate/nitrite transport system substrate-binding protein